jgi:hypothetical protein
MRFICANRISTFLARPARLADSTPPLPQMYQAGGKSRCKGLPQGRPQNLRLELPTKYDLVVNLKTAKVLGLTIPNPSSLAPTR